MSGRGAVSGKPSTRRYTPEEKEQAVRMVRTLRAELGTSQGTVKRVAGQHVVTGHRLTDLSKVRDRSEFLDLW